MSSKSPYPFEGTVNKLLSAPEPVATVTPVAAEATAGEGPEPTTEPDSLEVAVIEIYGGTGFSGGLGLVRRVGAEPIGDAAVVDPGSWLGS